jgi:hypothetical protein
MTEFSSYEDAVNGGDFADHINILGLKAVDKVTGFSGIITTVSFDLYGCIQVIVTPPVNASGDVTNGAWFDVTRLDIDYDSRVMDVPNFNSGYIATGSKGCSVGKPLR